MRPTVSATTAFLYFTLWLIPGTRQQSVVPFLSGRQNTINCGSTAAGDLVRVIWSKGSTTVFERSADGSTIREPSNSPLLGRARVIGNVNLQVDNMAVGDEGEYECHVTLDNPSVDDRVMHNVVVRVQPTDPVITVTPNDTPVTDVQVGTNFTLTCTSTGGRPPVNHTWTLDGTEISANTSLSPTPNTDGSGDTVSTVDVVIPDRKGQTLAYKCEAAGLSPIVTRTVTKTFELEKEPTTTPTSPQGQTGDPNVKPTNKAPQTGPDTGVIVGGVLGGIAGLALVAALVYFFLIREKKPGKGKEDGVESGDADVTYHATGHPGAPENMSRPPPNQPEVMYAELDLEKQPAGSRRPYVATPDDPPTEYASIRPNKPPRSSVPHTLAPDEKSEYASVSKPGTRY